jgi:hypothetical protein
MNKSNNYLWLFHLLIVAGMYLYYCSLWWEFIFYDGKAGWKGFGLFITTLTTAPLYLIFHTIAILLARSSNNKRLLIANGIGILLLVLHCIAVACS